MNRWACLARVRKLKLSFTHLLMLKEMWSSSKSWYTFPPPPLHLWPFPIRSCLNYELEFVLAAADLSLPHWKYLKIEVTLHSSPKEQMRWSVPKFITPAHAWPAWLLTVCGGPSCLHLFHLAFSIKDDYLLLFYVGCKFVCVCTHAHVLYLGRRQKRQGFCFLCNSANL